MILMKLFVGIHGLLLPIFVLNGEKWCRFKNRTLTAPSAIKPHVVTLSMRVWFSHGMSYLKTFVLMCCTKCNSLHPR